MNTAYSAYSGGRASERQVLFLRQVRFCHLPSYFLSGSLEHCSDGLLQNQTVNPKPCKDHAPRARLEIEEEKICRDHAKKADDQDEVEDGKLPFLEVEILGARGKVV